MRTILLIILATLVSPRMVYADDASKPSDNSVSKSDFIWPKEMYTISEEKWHHIKLEAAPPNFNFEGLTNEEAIGQARAVSVDLRRDGLKELFIDDGTGGSGGRGWSIYEKINRNWKRIGDGIGAPIICAPHNGYFQIAYWSRGGGGTFGKCLLRFEGDRYHLVRLEDWKDIDDEGHRQFVGARDPKPFDN
jgi:hypothetical protein